jgi:sec-independent protein translocase protein TatB
MFGLGFGEIMIILVLALVLLGPQRLPDAAKQIGKAMRDFKRATDDVKDQFDRAMYEVQSTGEERPRPVLAPTPGQDAHATGAPAGAVPAGVAQAPVPAATADNVPGLEAALTELPSPPATQPDPAAAAPAPTPSSNA